MAGVGSDTHVYEVEVRLDDRAPSVVALPVEERARRLEIAWAYGLEPGRHTIHLELLNPRPGEHIAVGDLIVYGARPPGRRF
jgi:hypothetical protein